MYPNTTLCEVQCEDGAQYAIRAHISGKLVEVNEQNLDKNPQLLVADSLDCGYIGTPG